MPPEQRPFPASSPSRRTTRCRTVAGPTNSAGCSSRHARRSRRGRDRRARRSRLVSRANLNGRTYIPATAPTSEGFEVFGYVAFEHGQGGEPASFSAHADYTDETADANPGWKLDLSDEEIDVWRGAAT